MFTIDRTIDIAAPLARVHTAVTTEAGYRAWLAQDADFDGNDPFAEGREAMLGFVLVRVNTADEACGIAGQSPHAEVGGAIFPTRPWSASNPARAPLARPTANARCRAMTDGRMRASNWS